MADGSTDISSRDLPTVSTDTFVSDSGTGTDATNTDAIPFTRIAQAKGGGASEFKNTSYFRLGGYSSDESDILPTYADPKPAVTRSTVSGTNKSGADYLSDSLEKPKTTDQEQGNTGSNKERELSYVTTAVDCTNEGILWYTDRDLMLNVQGAGFQKYGMGLSTVVAAGDVLNQVSAGQYTIKASSSINIQAGNGGESDANISMVAGNYISQKAFGPLSEITFGTSYKYTIGEATELFMGVKNTWAFSTEISGKLAATLSMFLGASCTIKIAAELNVTVGLFRTYKFSGEVTFVNGNKDETVTGMDMKTIIGLAYKGVVGRDASYIFGEGFKSTTQDMKVVETIDFKVADTDAKRINFEMKNAGIISITSKNASLAKSTLDATDEDVKTRMSNIDSKITELYTAL